MLKEKSLWLFGYNTDMNINIFFSLISIGLLMIFLIFKPLDIKEQKFVDVPLFELSSFTLFELDRAGLTTVMKGNQAIRYSNRYEVKGIDYTDNSKKYLANMKATNGIYKNNIVDLYGDVNYAREDGLAFETQKATYNKKTKIAKVTTKYLSYKGKNRITGEHLIYNNLSNRAESTNVVAKYQIQEREI